MMDDPKAYNRAWRLPVDLDLMPDDELIEYICEDQSDKPHLAGKSPGGITLRRLIPRTALPNRLLIFVCDRPHKVRHGSLRIREELDGSLTYT